MHMNARFCASMRVSLLVLSMCVKPPKNVCVCVCVRAFVCACVRACVRACMRACVPRTLVFSIDSVDRSRPTFIM